MPINIRYHLRKLLYNLFYANTGFHVMCELCGRPTHIDQLSGYYEDVSACLKCCPPGYRDPDAEACETGRTE